MAQITQSADTQAEWQTGTLDGVEATSDGDLVLSSSLVAEDTWVASPSGSYNGYANGIWFTVSEPTSLISAVIHAEAQSDHTISIHAGTVGDDLTNSTPVYTKDITVSSGEQTISIDSPFLEPGTYFITRDINTSNEWYRDLSPSISYPYTSASGSLIFESGGTSDGSLNDAYYFFFDLKIEVLYRNAVGTRTASTLDLSTLGTASETSTIEWSATDNAQTITIETALSTDNGTTWGAWQSATNGGSIPGISAGMDLSSAQLKCRQTLSTTDTAVTPQLHSLSITVREQSLLAGAITEMGNPVARTVRAYRRSDGTLLAETTSAATDGSFSMDVGIDEECYVVALDDTGDATDYNAQVADRLVPGN